MKKFMLLGLLVFCIFTTLFVGIVTSPKKENPLWEAIYELQSQVDSLNASRIELEERVNTIGEKLNQVRTIRFVEPNETMNNQTTYKDGAVFVWNPINSTNNCILSIRYYFQYRCEAVNPLQTRIEVNGDTHSGVGWLYSVDYTWSPTYPDYYLETLEIPFDIRTFPNQNNYTIKFQFASNNPGQESYVKNINIIVTVADGLPASNG